MAQVSDYTSLITSEHADKPKYMAMVTAVAQDFVDIQGMLLGLVSAFDVDEAVGVQLDAVGEWVGLKRNVRVPIENVYFSFDIANVGFDQGIWKRPEDPDTGVVTLDDQSYRLLLRAKIGANHWDGSMENSVAILDGIFSPEGLTPTLTDNQDMSMTVSLLGGNISALTRALINGGYIPIKPAGVRVSYEYQIYDLTLDGSFNLDGSQTLDGSKS